MSLFQKPGRARSDCPRPSNRAEDLLATYRWRDNASWSLAACSTRPDGKSDSQADRPSHGWQAPDQIILHQKIPIGSSLAEGKSVSNVLVALRGIKLGNSEFAPHFQDAMMVSDGCCCAARMFPTFRSGRAGRTPSKETVALGNCGSGIEEASLWLELSAAPVGRGTSS